MRFPACLLLAAMAIAAPAMAAKTSKSPYIGGFHPSDIIKKDVVILGGGASGTYAAMQLLDKGTSLLLIERNDYLGGQTFTYTDPASGNRTEMGVVAWYDYPIVQRFMKRLGVELATTDVARAGTTTLTTIPVDFRTGKTLDSVYSGNVTDGMLNYVTQLAKYPYLEDGFELPDPVPEDLLLPFGEFVEKYDISGAVQVLNIFGNGMGNFLEHITLYVFKLVSMATMKALQAGTFQNTRLHHNQLPFLNAQKILGDKALLSTTILRVDRAGPLIKIVVQTPKGQKLIVAKRVLATIPPTLSNLAGWDLNPTEHALFSKFQVRGYYTAIINATGIPPALEVRNFGADTPWNVPFLPGPYFVQATDTDGLFTVKYSSPTPIGDEAAKAAIVEAVERLKTGGSVETATTPQFVAFGSHAPFEFTVGVEEIKAGFYKKLYGLQGKKGLWWTGAAWHAQDSTKVWEFTETLLPDLLKGL